MTTKNETKASDGSRSIDGLVMWAFWCKVLIWLIFPPSKYVDEVKELMDGPRGKMLLMEVCCYAFLAMVGLLIYDLTT